MTCEFRKGILLRNISTRGDECKVMTSDLSRGFV